MTSTFFSFAFQIDPIEGKLNSFYMVVEKVDRWDDDDDDNEWCYDIMSEMRWLMMKMIFENGFEESRSLKKIWNEMNEKEEMNTETVNDAWLLVSWFKSCHKSYSNNTFKNSNKWGVIWITLNLRFISIFTTPKLNFSSPLIWIMLYWWLESWSKFLKNI